VSIPGDLSIVGFHDLFATRYMTPPLTTVGFDAFKIGELAAQLVLKTMEVPNEKQQPVTMTVKPKLIVRGSTGPALIRRALGTI
jgi:DNA-binding LacI/PurR family transcriptional regulator